MTISRRQQIDISGKGDRFLREKGTDLFYGKRGQIYFTAQGTVIAGFDPQAVGPLVGNSALKLPGNGK